jgi:exopolysaccharide biosynthesis protein
MTNENIIKKNQWLIVLLILVFGLVIRTLFSPAIAKASTMAQRLSGRILLDVRRDGRAWYVNPVDLRRYYLGKPADAFQIMRQLGLGITSAQLSQIPTSNEPVDWAVISATTTPIYNLTLTKRLSGRILLAVEENGEAWYVNPVDLRRYYLGRPADAFQIMRQLGLGISIGDLAKIHKPSLDESLDQYSNYQIKRVTTTAGVFRTDIITIDLTDPDLQIITDTANDNNCNGPCPARELIDYVGDHNGFAAINATYFETGAARRNYYFFPVYNSRLNRLINENQLKWWTTGPMMVFDENNKFYYFADSRDFGSVEQFELKYGVKIQAALGNKPRLIENYFNLLIDWELDNQQTTGKYLRAAIGYKDDKIYLVVVSQATVPDLALVMQELGVEYALNLDGGYSTALYYNDEYMVGPGRSIPNALIFAKTNLGL